MARRSAAPTGYAFKQLDVGELVPLDSIKPAVTQKKETPRQRAIREREEDIRAAFNIAATAPASLAVPIRLREGQKLATLRLAVQKVAADEPRAINWAVRGDVIYVSQGAIPGRRGRRKASAGS